MLHVKFAVEINHACLKSESKVLCMLQMVVVIFYVNLIVFLSMCKKFR